MSLVQIQSPSRCELSQHSDSGSGPLSAALPRSAERRYRGSIFYDRAYRSASLLATRLPTRVEQLRQFAAEGFQFCDSLIHIGELSRQPGLYTTARTPAMFGQNDDLSDFIQRKPKRLSLSNELDASHYFRRVASETTRRTRRWWNEVLALVIMKRLNPYSQSLCNVARERQRFIDDVRGIYYVVAGC